MTSSTPEFDPRLHNPDVNRVWTPLIGLRRYRCEECGTERISNTNHTGTLPAERCLGRCRTILHPHTEREQVLPAYKRHLYVAEA